MNAANSEDDRKRRIRRTTWLLSLLAIAIYVTYMLMNVLGK